MGVLFSIKVGESYTSGVAVLPGHIPTDPTIADTVGLFIGDTILNSQTTTHLVVVAIEQAMAAMKEALTNEGFQAIEDRYNIRDPIDPYKQVGQLLAVATEAHVWIGYEGDILDSSKSQFIVGAMEKLIAKYREDIGVGKGVIAYAVPGGAITVAAGTYISAASFDLTGEGVWRQGTLIDVAGTTDAGVFGLNAVLPKDMVLREVAQHLSEFLKGWSQATFAYRNHPTDLNITSVGMLAFAGGLAVSFDSLTITPVP